MHNTPKNPVGRPRRGKEARVSINARVTPETKKYLLALGLMGVSIDQVVKFHMESYDAGEAQRALHYLEHGPKNSDFL